MEFVAGVAAKTLTVDDGTAIRRASDVAITLVISFLLILIPHKSIGNYAKITLYSITKYVIMPIK